jgi:hypothetical protein
MYFILPLLLVWAGAIPVQALDSDPLPCMTALESVDMQTHYLSRIQAIQDAMTFDKRKQLVLEFLNEREAQVAALSDEEIYQSLNYWVHLRVKKEGYLPGLSKGTNIESVELKPPLTLESLLEKTLSSTKDPKAMDFLSNVVGATNSNFQFHLMTLLEGLREPRFDTLHLMELVSKRELYFGMLLTEQLKRRIRDKVWNYFPSGFSADARKDYETFKAMTDEEAKGLIPRTRTNWTRDLSGEQVYRSMESLF